MAATKPLKVETGKRKRWTTGDFLNLLHGGLGGDYSATGPGAWWQASAGAAPSVGLLPLQYGGTARDNSGTNVGMGSGVFGALTTGTNNTFLGDLAGGTVTSATYAVAAGYRAYGDTGAKTGAGMIALGYNAFGAATSAEYGVAIGHSACESFITESGIGIGFQALRYATGVNLTAVGYQAGHLTTSGIDNSVFGAAAGYFNTTGDGNCIFGLNALYNSALLDYNCVFGRNAMFTATDANGSSACVFGDHAAYSATIVDVSVIVGAAAAYSCTGSTADVVIGTNAGSNMEAITSGFGNRVIIGYNAGLYAATRTTLIGAGAGAQIDSTSVSNTLVGESAFSTASTTASENSIFGFVAAAQMASGSSYNSIFGSRAAYGATGGGNLCAFGYQALYSNTTGLYNSALGSQARYGLTTGSYCCFFGYQAGTTGPITGANNNGFGAQCLYNISTGQYNNAFGTSALYTETTGVQNSAFGDGALAFQIAANYNSAFGHNAGYGVTTGSSNNLFGTNAGKFITTGSENTIIGVNSAGTLTTGSNCIVIGGNDCDVLSATASDQVNVGNAFEKRPVSKEIVIRTEATAYANSASYNLAGSYTDQVGWFRVVRKKSTTVTIAEFTFDGIANTTTRISGGADIKDTAGGAPGANDIRFTLTSGTMTIDVGTTGACDIGIIFGDVVKF